MIREFMNNNKKLRMLFIAYFFPPVTGTGVPAIQRVMRFIRYLENVESHVLTVVPSDYPNFVTVGESGLSPVVNGGVYRTHCVGLYDRLISLLNRFKTSREKNHGDGVGATWGPCSNDLVGKRRRLLDDLKDEFSSLFTYPDFARPWIWNAVWKGVSIVRENGIDWIFATGMPWSSLLIGYLLKRITSVRLIVDFRDPWVGNPYIEKTGLERRIDRLLEKKIIHRADIIAANTWPLQREMLLRYPECSRRIQILPNGFDPADLTGVLARSFPFTGLIVSHAGFLYLKRDPNCVLEALRIFRKRYPNRASEVQFHHVGNVSLGYDLEERCRREGLTENVVLTGQISHRDCLGYLLSSDVLLLIQPGTRTQIPSKLYEYLYLNKPIVAVTEKNGALARLMTQYRFGEAFEPNDPTGLADCLHRLLERKDKTSHLFAEYPERERFDARQIAAKLQSLMASAG